MGDDDVFKLGAGDDQSRGDTGPGDTGLPDSLPDTTRPAPTVEEHLDVRERKQVAESADMLGSSLATEMSEKGYQPVVLFGTAFSGKTSLLLSLFSSILSQGKFETGLFLANPVISTTTPLGERLYADARHTFEIKTQNFIEGVPTAKTNIDLPFFIPVEFRPRDKPPVTFAFLESNGEWYRPTRQGDSLFPRLKSAIENFVSTYQGGIIFIYLLPYTQSHVYAPKDETQDAREISDASLAMSGVLRAYNDIRANYRAQDRHLMLVSKWDANSVAALDRAAALAPDRDEVEEFCERRYGQAIATYRGLQLSPDQLLLNAYCAGIINERGLLQLKQEDESRAAVLDYPIRLWDWLYRCALLNVDHAPVSPFPEPPRKPAIARLVQTILNTITN